MLICSFSMMVRLVVISSWLSAVIKQANGAVCSVALIPELPMQQPEQASSPRPFFSLVVIQCLSPPHTCQLHHLDLGLFNL
jgi:hypothetical protein